MKELKDMIGSRKRVIALALLAVALGVVYLAATHRWFFAGRHGGDQKVLYWYDAMNPQHHYDKPGKAPDGMDLVPAYADHPDSSAVGMSTQGQAESGRKVMYWYDAMNPQRHYDKPGKAPDGMDLVPMYAPQQSTSPSATAERKVLYWYDPMHPAYKSDKPGIAPDCGMTLVPEYAADESINKMPAGTVVIPEDKQSLAGVRTTQVARKALTRDIRTTAQIVADETRIAHVPVKGEGE